MQTETARGQWTVSQNLIELKKQERDGFVRELFYRKGIHAKEISAQMLISIHTVYRILRGGK